jgi:hypothetical protein
MLEKVLNPARKFGLARKILQRLRDDPTLAPTGSCG